MAVRIRHQIKWALTAALCFAPPLWASQSLSAGQSRATISLTGSGDQRTYELTTNVNLRDNKPADKRITFSEDPGHASIRTGNLLFDGLYAMAISEALADSVPQISDGSYGHGSPVQIEAFQTGELWRYVWTRDLSYSLYLALAGFDPARAVNSLLFKASGFKPSVAGEPGGQVIQDTGSGGSYPVSTDRVVWAMGVHETLKYLSAAAREDFLQKAYPILCDTIEQDRRLVFNPADGLYRGEQSFLDWREQTYPGWTRDNVLPIAMSETLSVNAADYFLLRTAAEYSGLLNQTERRWRYGKWADALKEAINSRLFDAQAGMYRSYLISDDGSYSTPEQRYDLLGESLAVLFGVADQDRAESIIKHYPTGPFGPPVVWPQEKSVPIYHNQGIWPFVTAYWTKAAQKAGNSGATDAGMQSLEQLAALNLSNMENYDFVTGQSHVDSGARKGPVIDSRRQLWSVAGYLSMVQDVVFGLDTSWDGIRFAPAITAKLRNVTFGSTDVIELRNWSYKGSQNLVRVHLPPAGSFSEGFCVPDRTLLNEKPLGEDYAKLDTLKASNTWNIYLKAPEKQIDPTAPLVDVSNERAIFGPAQPEWNGIAVEGGRLSLTYRDADAAQVSFNIYRDGQLCAQGVRETSWTDAASGDYQTRVHSYAVQAVDLATGNISHLTPGRSYRTPDEERVIPAKVMSNRGGNLVGNHHFENWGRPGDQLDTGSFQVNRAGRYLVRAEFSNGAGPVNTGITCAVKKLEVRKVENGEVLASSYLVMPQSGNWNRWDMSSTIPVTLNPGEQYAIRIFEDQYSRNMSYLQNNDRYTGGSGGGDQSSNFVDIAAIHLLYTAPVK